MWNGVNTAIMRARVILCLLAFWTLAVPGLAAERQGRVSLDRVLPEIRRTTPGTLYDAEGPFAGPDGSPTYRIKWMTPEGRIIWFYADARTGRVMGAGPGPVGPVPFPQPHPVEGGYPHFRDGGWPPGGSPGDGEQGRGNWNNGGDRGDGRGHHGG
jgi:hypothetical protein